MKSQMTFATPLFCALFALVVPAGAQPAAKINGLPFPLVSPARAENLTVTAPIKLALDNVTLAAALDELQKQGGIKLELQDESPETLAKTLSVHLETLSFNRAFAEIMSEAGVTALLQRSYYDRSWTVFFEEEDRDIDAVQSAVGLFQTRLTSLNTEMYKKLNLNDNGDNGERTEKNDLTLNLTLSPDPRLPLIGGSRPRITRADDDQGRSLLPDPNPDADPDNYRNGAHSFYQNTNRQRQDSLNLLPPAPDAKTLAHLEGVVVYALVTQTETWELPDLLSQPAWKRAFKSGDQRFEIALTPMLKGARDLNLVIEVTTDGTIVKDQVNHPLLAPGPVMAALRVVDAKGTVLRRKDGGTNAEAQKLVINTQFYPISSDSQDTPALKLPLSLSFEAPLEIVQTQVPFSFENVPLP